MLAIGTKVMLLGKVRLRQFVLDQYRVAGRAEAVLLQRLDLGGSRRSRRALVVVVIVGANDVKEHVGGDDGNQRDNQHDGVNVGAWFAMRPGGITC